MDPAQSLLQYGAIGAITVLLLAAVRVLFARMVEELKYERDRADRLEAELRELNRTAAHRYQEVINDSTRAVGEAMALVRHLRSARTLDP